MAPTPSSKSNQAFHTPNSKLNHTQIRTPQSKNRLNFGAKDNPQAEHPVEVIGRIRDIPETKEKSTSALHIDPDRNSLRVRTDIGYRDFSLDGISSSEDEDLDGFYKKFVGARINGVKLGAKCTIMMYGPTGSGKSYTMFGSPKQPGIVYRSLRDILGEDDGESEGVGFVQVTVLEIYNEEIYDLLSTTNSGGGFGFGWPKGNASKVRLEVMGKKAKNATFISGTEAAKISKEIQKVEKRRIIKSTLCNERSSRSHCLIILDVPTVGGRLMLVDMAGSENIEQAGQTGFEAKMQTGKINQGNIALKRVVESIANGDSHVPFRDSKLTMLLQDSFEDDKSKILMILCASPDSKEMHKTISTLEYGAKAKCIVRGPHTPIKDKNGEDSSSAVILGSRLTAMNQFILKLEMEKKLSEKERNDAHKELAKKEEEISLLRAKLLKVEGKEMGASEEEINLKVNERTQKMKRELEQKVKECEKMASDLVELERKKMEETIRRQKEEVEMLRRRLEEIELELRRSRERNGENLSPSNEIDGNGFAKRLMEVYADEDPGMIKSMDLDRSMDFDTCRQEIIVSNNLSYNSNNMAFRDPASIINRSNEKDHDVFAPSFANKAPLSTVFEEDEGEEEEDKENFGDEVQKEVIEEKTIYSSFSQDPNFQNFDNLREKLGENNTVAKNPVFNRQARIQNIFTLCGNYRELSQQNVTPAKTTENDLVKSSFDENYAGYSLTDKMNKVGDNFDLKENYEPTKGVNSSGDEVEVYVKWEVSKEQPGKCITTLKVAKDATLADLRKLIEIYMGTDKQGFVFLALGESAGAPVSKEKEDTVYASKLPISNQFKGHLACLRPNVKGIVQYPPNQLPLTPLQNILNVTAAR